MSHPTEHMTRAEFADYLRHLRECNLRRDAAHEAVRHLMTPEQPMTHHERCQIEHQRPFWATRPPSSPAAEHIGKFYPRLHTAGIEHADPNAPRSDT
jgi:hypothetical protein